MSRSTCLVTWGLLALGSFGSWSIASAASLTLTYQAKGGPRLRYVVSAPELQSGRKYPLWIFQPGDGSILDTFQPEAFLPMMEQFTRTFGIALVMPELRRQIYTHDLKKYCELDFFHRIADLSALIDVAQHLSFVDSSRIILFGHSAGGEIVTLAAKTRSDIQGVATYGTGVVSIGEMQAGLPVPESILKNDCSNPSLYKKRSGLFWRQLFVESKLFATIRSLSVPYLALFGGSDSVLPFDANAANYARRLTTLKPDFSYVEFPGLDHGGFAKDPAVFEQVKAWSEKRHRKQ